MDSDVRDSHPNHHFLLLLFHISVFFFFVLFMSTSSILVLKELYLNHYLKPGACGLCCTNIDL